MSLSRKFTLDSREELYQRLLYYAYLKDHERFCDQVSAALDGETLSLKEIGALILERVPYLEPDKSVPAELPYMIATRLAGTDADFARMLEFDLRMLISNACELAGRMAMFRTA